MVIGLDGAILRVRERDRVRATLYYDPATVEGEFAERHPGCMMGMGAAFVAALVVPVLRSGLSGLGDGVRDGIVASRRLLSGGFGPATGLPDWSPAEVFRESPERSPRTGRGG